MSYKSKEAITCKCGNIGHIKIIENDQPYSETWASYSLEGLNGTIENFDNMLGITESAVKKLICAKCGQKIP